jgi:hypothetical protein
MAFNYEPGIYVVTGIVPQVDGALLLSFEDGQDYVWYDLFGVVMKGDLFQVVRHNSGIKMTVESSGDPKVPVGKLLETCRRADVKRLRRLTYDLKGFTDLLNIEQETIFMKVTDLIDLDLFILRCQSNQYYRIEGDYTRAIRDVCSVWKVLP